MYLNIFLVYFWRRQEIVEKWKNNPILKPCDVGMLFLLELKPPLYPPDQYNGYYFKLNYLIFFILLEDKNSFY